MLSPSPVHRAVVAANAAQTLVIVHIQVLSVLLSGLV